MNYNQAKKEGNRIDYVFELAKTDKGMTARDTVLFHLHNPNGNYALCREWGNEAYFTGYFVYGIFAAIGLVFILLLLPETKNKSLEELEVMLVKEKKD